MHGMMKYLSLLLLLSLLFGCVPAHAASTPEEADHIFVNGVIYTADSEDSIVEALAVKDGKILFVGTSEEAQAYAGDGTIVQDLAGAFMMPGLIDAHIHSILPTFFDMNVADCTTLDQLMEIVTTYIAEHPDQASYFGFGYAASLFEGIEIEKGPRKERLDEICPDKPLAIMAYAGHELWANSAFLEKHGIIAAGRHHCEGRRNRRAVGHDEGHGDEAIGGGPVQPGNAAAGAAQPCRAV